jgi:hypothetical protein
MSGRLLCVFELGGYPNFAPLYERLGYEVLTVQAGRKAVAAAKDPGIKAIVAEFNLQRDFRDRTSALESVLAVTQKRPETRVVVFYDREVEPELRQLCARFPFIRPLAYPIDPDSLGALLETDKT